MDAVDKGVTSVVFHEGENLLPKYANLFPCFPSCVMLESSNNNSNNICVVSPSPSLFSCLNTGRLIPLRHVSWQVDVADVAGG
jgi:hypothetical protein